jgi:hypothetical protein
MHGTIDKHLAIRLMQYTAFTSYDLEDLTVGSLLCPVGNLKSSSNL